MKKFLLLALSLLFISLATAAQHYYPEIVSHGGTATPVNGIKIKTNLPYTNGSHMPAVFIQGYNYNTGEPISIAIVWYVYNGNFYRYGASSSGSYTPELKLANENGKVVIYINDRQYYQRFFVSAFAKKGESATWFTGWTIADEPLGGTNTVTVPYKSRLAGDIGLPGGIWNKDGNVGIGTSNTRDNKLAVNGDIRAQEVKVEVANWPDYVFDRDYPLLELTALETYIHKNGHLPEIPSASEITADGLSLGATDAKLLKKIEELTLYIIRQNKTIQQLGDTLHRMNIRHNQLEKQLLEIERQFNTD